MSEICQCMMDPALLPCEDHEVIINGISYEVDCVRVTQIIGGDIEAVQIVLAWEAPVEKFCTCDDNE